MPILNEDIQPKQSKAPWWVLVFVIAAMPPIVAFTWSLFRAVEIPLGGKSRLSLFRTSYALAYIDDQAPYSRTQFPEGARNDVHVFKLPGGQATGWYYVWLH